MARVSHFSFFLYSTEIRPFKTKINFLKKVCKLVPTEPELHITDAVFCQYLFNIYQYIHFFLNIGTNFDTAGVSSLIKLIFPLGSTKSST